MALACRAPAARGEVVVRVAAAGRREQSFGSSGKVTAICRPTALPHLIAVAEQEHRIRVLDLRAEREVAVCVGHSDRITNLVWSPDGKCLASSSEDRAVRLWDGTTGGCLVELDGPVSPRSLTWSEDSSRLTLVSRDNKVVTWVLPGRSDDIVSGVEEERVLSDEERIRYDLVAVRETPPIE